MARPIRVLCVDDHRIVREGIALILSREPDIEVIGRAATGEEAVSLFTRHRPDITLMDLRLKAMSGCPLPFSKPKYTVFLPPIPIDGSVPALAGRAELPVTTEYVHV